MNKKTILLGLNELNFDYIKFYCQQGKLPAFQQLLKQYDLVETTSEEEHHLQEPWIQWVTIHSGKTYAEHQVFRLGDIVDRPEISQIWEELEAQGLSVGAVSPLNAANRLESPAFFVPDPWTKTDISSSKLLHGVYLAVQQMVNDNAHKKVTLKSIIWLLLGGMYYISPKQWWSYFKLLPQIGKAGIKAVILDKLLADIFLKSWESTQPDFSSLFLNTGAHIQHHYLFNSQAYDGPLKNPEWYCPEAYDPLEKILVAYDEVLGRLLKLDVQLLLATGLHQKPHEEVTFYWRLKNHVAFMEQVGITNYREVLPRMSRDFLIRFDEETQAREAGELLTSYRMDHDQEAIFKVDNRGKSLFVELTYSKNILGRESICAPNGKEVGHFKEYLSFVAIKNGEHDGMGYLVANFPTKLAEPVVPLKAVKSIILAATKETRPLMKV